MRAEDPRRISWIVAPPEICSLCKEPLARPAETSSWNGAPAHRECVRVHLIHRDPAFRTPDHEDGSDEHPESLDEGIPRDDDDGE